MSLKSGGEERAVHESNNGSDFHYREDVFCFAIYSDAEEVDGDDDQQENRDRGPTGDWGVPILESDCCCHDF
jgi:hypothetical protein